jgi:hypothetical protein
MKIKTKNDQLREEVEQVQILIRYTQILINKTHDKLLRKQNWGILSFFTKSECNLRYDYEKLREILHKLNDYEDSLLKSIEL